VFSPERLINYYPLVIYEENLQLLRYPNQDLGLVNDLGTYGIGYDMYPQGVRVTNMNGLNGSYASFLVAHQRLLPKMTDCYTGNDDRSVNLLNREVTCTAYRIMIYLLQARRTTHTLLYY
jgi:hypothetical protein